MKIEIDVPDGVSGDWKVETFEITEEKAKFENMRASFSPGGASRWVEAGVYKKLTRKGQCIMSNTRAEIDDHMDFISRATGSILINGLGLGVALTEILKKPNVHNVTIIELSPDVIKLSGPTYLKDERVQIIEADAFAYQPPKGMRYDVCFHDIWDNICADNLPEMAKLHRKYGKRCDWQGSWAKDMCQYHASQEKRESRRWAGIR